MSNPYGVSPYGEQGAPSSSQHAGAEYGVDTYGAASEPTHRARGAAQQGAYGHEQPQPPRPRGAEEDGEPDGGRVFRRATPGRRKSAERERPRTPPQSVLDQEPETTIGETLSIEGRLTFERLLRIDGKFEGELVSKGGSLIVGARGELVGDVLPTTHPEPP